MNISTGQFEALTETAERVVELEQRVSEMELMARDLVQIVRIFWDGGYQAAEESILGTRARTEAKPHPPRHLRSIGDDTP